MNKNFGLKMKRDFYTTSHKLIRTHNMIHSDIIYTPKYNFNLIFLGYL